MNTDTAAVFAAMPFAVALGIELVSAEPEQVVARMPWDAHRCTIAGVTHGGALMAFADSVGALCAFLNLPDGARTSTIESKTNFFRAHTSGLATATVTPLHVGRTTIVVASDIRDDAGKRLALVTQTQAVLR